ncbi:MAG: bifunctional o-acetylhomoserine/o-acetylserine sulfhydrylase [Bifidobacteriaceae bacterium]|jgi:O-acetylhomoserine (thiol)-lyase|nr:bifunctional o-acetylhomoserine/o-acetylserine sulfhydrylase [Bifidobacteriaceae bacterium]
MSQEWSFETKQIHAGQAPDPGTGARALPIFQTTSYVFPSAKTAAARFALQELGPIYTRLTNPTQEVVENRIAALEGGAGGLLTASGASATTLAILNIAGTGDHIVSAASLYGGTYSLFANTLPRFGVQTSFVDDPTDLDQWRRAIRPNTKLLFGETIPNPKTDVLDIEGIAAVAHEAGLPLLVDNTVATPYLIKPIDWGADVVIHSATKYLGGHGNSIGGAIVDAGRFDYAAAGPGRYPGFTTPDPAYNGLVFGEVFGPDGVFGVNLSYILKVRAQLLRDIGPAISPFNAFLLAQGIETLSLRVERHVDNALAVAKWLQARPDVRLVHYAGLESSPYHQLARKYAPRGPGAVLAFEIDGGAAAGQAFASALKLHSNVANIGDVRSLVIHPASTTHSQLSPKEQALSAVTPGLVRLAVGLEGIDDILADLELGFAAARQVNAASSAQSAPAAPAAPAAP